jgi:hypothetical protein
VPEPERFSKSCFHKISGWIFLLGSIFTFVSSKKKRFTFVAEYHETESDGGLLLASCYVYYSWMKLKCTNPKISRSTWAPLLFSVFAHSGMLTNKANLIIKILNFFSSGYGELRNDFKALDDQIRV